MPTNPNCVCRTAFGICASPLVPRGQAGARCVLDSALMVRCEHQTPRQRPAIIPTAPPPRAAPCPEPIPMVLHCPGCGRQHIDKPGVGGGHGEPAWTNPPHRSHLCAACGHIWRPADVPTTGVAAVGTRGRHDSPIKHPPVALPAGLRFGRERQIIDSESEE